MRLYPFVFAATLLAAPHPVAATVGGDTTIEVLGVSDGKLYVIEESGGETDEVIVRFARLDRPGPLRWVVSMRLSGAQYDSPRAERIAALRRRARPLVEVPRASHTLHRHPVRWFTRRSEEYEVDLRHRRDAVRIEAEGRVASRQIEIFLATPHPETRRRFELVGVWQIPPTAGQSERAIAQIRYLGNAFESGYFVDALLELR